MHQSFAGDHDVCRGASSSQPQNSIGTAGASMLRAEACYTLKAPSLVFQPLDQEPYAFGDPYPQLGICRGVSMAPGRYDVDDSKLSGLFSFMEADQVCSGPGALQLEASGSAFPGKLDYGCGTKCDAGVDSTLEDVESLEIPLPALERFGGANEYFPSPWTALEIPQPEGKFATIVDQLVAEQEYSPDSQPPKLPTHPFFQLCLTTIFLRAASPATLGNDLVSFLCEELNVQTMKVRVLKFTAKAEVLCEGCSCTVKFCVYDLGDGAYVVEVQRRMGDAVEFGRVFRQLEEYLALRYEIEEKPAMEGLTFEMPSWHFEQPVVAAC